MPRETGAGAEVISGCINQTGTLRIRVSRPYGESTVSKYWIWWRTPAAKNQSPRHLSHVLPDTTHPRLWQQQHCLPYCRLLLPGRRLPLDTQGADIPGDLLPVCARNLCSAEFLRRHRRSFKVRCADQGKQLPGGTGKSRDCCV